MGILEDKARAELEERASDRKADAVGEVLDRFREAVDAQA